MKRLVSVLGVVALLCPVNTVAPSVGAQESGSTFELAIHNLSDTGTPVTMLVTSWGFGHECPGAPGPEVTVEPGQNAVLNLSSGCLNWAVHATDAAGRCTVSWVDQEPPSEGSFGDPFVGTPPSNRGLRLAGEGTPAPISYTTGECLSVPTATIQITKVVPEVDQAAASNTTWTFTITPVDGGLDPRAGGAVLWTQEPGGPCTDQVSLALAGTTKEANATVQQPVIAQAIIENEINDCHYGIAETAVEGWDFDAHGDLNCPGFTSEEETLVTYPTDEASPWLPLGSGWVVFSPVRGTCRAEFHNSANQVPPTAKPGFTG